MLPLIPLPAPPLAGGWSPLMWIVTIVVPAMLVSLLLTRFIRDADQATSWIGEGKPPLRLRIQRWILIVSMLILGGGVLYVLVKMILDLGRM